MTEVGNRVGAAGILECIRASASGYRVIPRTALDVIFLARSNDGCGSALRGEDPHIVAGTPRGERPPGKIERRSRGNIENDRIAGVRGAAVARYGQGRRES